MNKTIKIKVRYQSKCNECKETLTQGDLAYFEPQSPDYLKLTCLPCFEATGEDLEVVEGKKQLSTNDLSSPTQDCHNEDCSNKCSAKTYFCLSCHNKLPPILKDAISLAYDTYRKDKKRYLDVITYAHKECLPFLEKP